MCVHTVGAVDGLCMYECLGVVHALWMELYSVHVCIIRGIVHVVEGGWLGCFACRPTTYSTSGYEI